jgi:predicted transcriptional regulator
MTSLYRQYKSASPELSDEQKERIHQVTHGIPIIVKHCFGQIYEYNRPFDSVVDNLSAVGATKVVEFSFEEILKLVKGDQCQLEMILLLELINCPVMTRQIADILERDESEVTANIPSLVNFQCVKRAIQGLEEKYVINDEIRLLTRRLIQENTELVRSIREKITKNFTIEKQMNYTTEELGILGIFENYLSQKQYLEAESFIKDQLDKKARSILLKYHYARYLKEQKRETDRAIEILESIREASNNHISILRLLVSCYTSLDIPNFDRASVYVKQIENTPFNDESLKLEIAEFYVRWSISIRMYCPNRSETKRPFN